MKVRVAQRHVLEQRVDPHTGYVTPWTNQRLSTLSLLKAVVTVEKVEENLGGEMQVDERKECLLIVITFFPRAVLLSFNLLMVLQYTTEGLKFVHCGEHR